MSTASDTIPKQLKIKQLDLISNLFAELPNKIYYKNAALEYIWANASHLNRLNINSLNELSGKQDSDFLPKSVVAVIQNEEKSVIDSGMCMLNKTLQLSTTETDQVWIQMTIVPVYDNKKNVAGILSISNETLPAQQTVISEKDLIANLLASSQDPIYFKDRQSKFICACQQYVKKMGAKDSKELIGKSEFDYIPETQAQAAYNIEQEVMSSGQSMHGKISKEIQLDGDVIWVQKSTMPLKDSQGNVIGTFAVSKNITAQKQAETELEATNQKLLAISKQADMNQVANNILHNVGNVLNSVNIAASTATSIVESLKVQSVEKTAELLDKNINTPEFLSKDEKGKQIPNFLHQLAGKLNSDQETAISELNSLTDYINHIKEVLNMQQTNFKNTDISEKIKLSRLVAKAVDINRGSLTRHEIMLSIDIINDAEILIDKHKTLQILVNLIRNAKQACDDSNQREKKVNISANNNDKDSVYIDVSDNGIGISDESIKKIFDHGYTTKKDGNGFGLHSCLNLTKELGATLSAHSDGLGEGSTFTLTLPKKPPEL